MVPVNASKHLPATILFINPYKLGYNPYNYGYNIYIYIYSYSINNNIYIYVYIYVFPTYISTDNWKLHFQELMADLIKP